MKYRHLKYNTVMIVIASMVSCLKIIQQLKRTQFEKYYLWIGAVLSVQHTISAPLSPKIEKLKTYRKIVRQTCIM